MAPTKSVTRQWRQGLADEKSLSFTVGAADGTLWWFQASHTVLA